MYTVKFCSAVSTLVDRIVTGYPRNEAQALCEQLGYEDNLIDTGEVFGFWGIEGPQSLKEELPFEKAGLPVIICDDHKPYKQVRGEDIYLIRDDREVLELLQTSERGRQNAGECSL